MKHLLFYLQLMTAFCLAACAQTASLTSEDANAVIETQVGTTVNNPGNYPSKPKNLIVVSVENESSSAESSGGSDCKIYHGKIQNARTQICSATPNAFQFGLLQLDLSRCNDTSGSSTPCDHPSKAITQHVTLYSGTQKEFSVAQDPLDLSELLASVSDEIETGGLSLTIAYFGQTFPNDPTHPQFVAEYAGRNFRICTIPHERLTPEQRLAACGNEAAEFGDFLLDLNGDGVFGYLSQSALDAGTLSETSVRTDRADSVQGLIGGGNRSDSLRVDDGSELDGYLRLTIPFDQTVLVNSSTAHLFEITLNLTDTLHFIDGLTDWQNQEPVCVASLFPDQCRSDSDPESVGIFDPIYDAEPFVSLPQAITRVTNTEGEATN